MMNDTTTQCKKAFLKGLTRTWWLHLLMHDLAILFLNMKCRPHQPLIWTVGYTGLYCNNNNRTHGHAPTFVASFIYPIYYSHMPGSPTHWPTRKRVSLWMRPFNPVFKLMELLLAWLRPHGWCLFVCDVVSCQVASTPSHSIPSEARGLAVCHVRPSWPSYTVSYIMHGEIALLYQGPHSALFVPHSFAQVANFRATTALFHM